MNTIKTYIVSIAGFDPSSGAGITSDIKTFTAHGLYGLSVCTNVTVQNDTNFKSNHWIPIDNILMQIDTLFERFSIDIVKIGLVENWSILFQIVKRLKEINPKIKIILDPILTASSGFNFHKKDNIFAFNNLLEHIYLITPNYLEIEALFSSKSIEETINHIASKTNLYLKGGHRKDKKGWDELYYNQMVQINIKPILKTVSEKHGSGCVLSSAIASNLCLHITLEDACKNAKYYTEQFLSSNTSLLGTHTKI